MRPRNARQRCQQLVAATPMPQPWSLDRFIEMVAVQRGRALLVHEISIADILDGAPCGLWVETEVADHVFVAQSTPVHRTQIVLHEISHMLAGHDRADPEWTRLLTPDVDPDVVRSVLGRSSYTSEQEREAETIATLIAVRAPSVGRGVADTLARMHRQDPRRTP